jgi:hypothetical protein
MSINLNVEKKSICFSLKTTGLILSMLLISHNGNAGYIIVKKLLCPDGSMCIEPMLEDDPQQHTLYQILHEYTWPTSRHPPGVNTEKEDLVLALKQQEALNGRYEFIWVPDTIQDLSCAAALLSSGRLVIERDNYRSIPMEYRTKSFTFKTDDTVELLLAQPEPNLSVALDEYFSNFQILGESYFFDCNRHLSHLLIHDASADLHSADQRVGLQIIENLFTDQAKAQSIRARVAQLYSEQALRYCTESSSILCPNIKELSVADRKTVLDHVIQLEVESNGRNEALLFRGTKGIGTLSGTMALDNALLNDHRKGRTQGSSLSYGSTLFAGLMTESKACQDPKGLACAMNYFRGSKFGYAVKLSRQDPNIRRMFDIPPLGLIGRLFAKGEFFHPRTRVGTKGIPPATQVSGFGDFCSHSVLELNRLNLVVEGGSTSEELARAINEYLLRNSILLAEQGEVPTAASAQSVLDAQSSLLRTEWVPSEAHVDAVVAAVLAHPESPATFKAGVGQLLRTKEEDHAVLARLFALLYHPDENIRSLAVQSLQNTFLDSPIIHRKLSEKLDDPSEKIRGEAARALHDQNISDADTLKIITRRIEREPSKAVLEMIIGIFNSDSGKPVELTAEVQIAIASKMLECAVAEYLFRDRIRPIDSAVLPYLYSCWKTGKRTEVVLDILKGLEDEKLEIFAAMHSEFQHDLLRFLLRESYARVPALKLLSKIRKDDPQFDIELIHLMADKSGPVRATAAASIQDRHRSSKHLAAISACMGDWYDAPLEESRMQELLELVLAP